MLWALSFLVAAVVGGALCTYLYARGMPLPARLCMGTVTSLALLATFGFLGASFFGMTRVVLWVTLGAFVVFSMLALRRHITQIRRDIADLIPATQRALRCQRGVTAGYVIFYAGASLLLALVFANAMYSQPDGIYTGVANNLADLPFHLQIILGFAYGHNFPPEHPEYANARFAYPFLCDFLTAMLVRAGIPVARAMYMLNLLLAISFVGLMHYWTVQLTRDRLAGIIAPVLILFSGGLGWWLIFRDVRASDSGIGGLLQHLPRAYTIENASGALLRWGNSLTTLFVPQRSILFGLPLALVIFSLWWSSVCGDNGAACRRVADEQRLALNQPQKNLSQGGFQAMLASGVLAGMLPLIHIHTFMVVIMIGGCLALTFRTWRLWLAFFIPALAIALPEMLWSIHGSGVHAQNFLGWFPGWDRGDANAIWFWLVNTGAFIPLLIIAIFWKTKDGDLVPTYLLRFYLPFVLCFLVPNIIKLAPWGWDNIKVLFYWYLGSAPLVALLLSTWLKQKSGLRWTALALLASLTLAGALDVVRVVSGMEAFREFDSDGAEIARAIVRQTKPRALVLHAPTFNSPVFLTGRRSLLGYAGTIVSHGLDYRSREDDIRQIYAGAPQARALLQKYGIDYVLVSPMERSQLEVNDAFWNQFALAAAAARPAPAAPPASGALGVLLDVELPGLVAVVLGVQVVGVGAVRVVRRLLVLAGPVRLHRLAVVPGRMFVVFRRLVVVFQLLFVGHVASLG